MWKQSRQSSSKGSRDLKDVKAWKQSRQGSSKRSRDLKDVKAVRGEHRNPLVKRDKVKKVEAGKEEEWDKVLCVTTLWEGTHTHEIDIGCIECRIGCVVVVVDARLGLGSSDLGRFWN